MLCSVNVDEGHHKPPYMECWLSSFVIFRENPILLWLFQGGGGSGPPAPLWICSCKTNENDKGNVICERTINAKLCTASYFVYACSEALVGLHICYLTMCKMATCNLLALMIDSEIIFKVAKRNKRNFTRSPVGIDIWGSRSKITISHWPNPNAIDIIAIRPQFSTAIVYNIYWQFN